MEWLTENRYSKSQRTLPNRFKKHFELWYRPMKSLATSQKIIAKIWKDATKPKNSLWMPLEAFHFESSPLKCKDVQKGQIENWHIPGMCVCFDSVWEIITLHGINSHFSFLRLFKTVHVTDAGKMGVWMLVLC